MRYLLLIALVCALVVPAFAKEVTIGGNNIADMSAGTTAANLFSGVFGGKSENDLINDDGGIQYWWSGPSGFGSTYDMTGTGGGYLVEMSTYVNGTISSHNVALDVFGWTGTRPDETDSYFGGRATFPGSGPYTNEWAVFDVSGEGAFLPDGDMITLFSEGGSYPWYCPQDGNGGAPDNSGWMWFGGTSWTDYSNYGFGSMMIRGVYNDDMDGPYAADQNPADGAGSVPVDSDILFDIQDDDVGVDSSTINTSSVVVTDDTKAVIPGSVSIDDGDPNDVHVTFDPDSDFDEGVIVTVTVSPSGNEITDTLGNGMAEDSWSFTVYMTGVESASIGEIKANFK